MVLELILELMAAFIGTVAFCILFHAPVKEYVICGITGVLGWAVYALTEPHTSIVAASFFAALIIALAARIFAVWRRVPTNMFIISGIFPIIPGIGIYDTIYELMNGSGTAALSSGLETFKALLAIVLGIVVVFVIPYSVFNWIGRGFDNLRAKMKVRRKGQGPGEQ